MPRVINTSANVKPRLMVLFSAARNGSMPVPIPVKELKLPCPPPGKSCRYCVFHNSSPFLVLHFITFFIKENIFIFSDTLSPCSRYRLENKYIFFKLFCKFPLLAIVISFRYNSQNCGGACPKKVL